MPHVDDYESIDSGRLHALRCGAVGALRDRIQNHMEDKIAMNVDSFDANGLYKEPTAACILGVDINALRRWRRNGHIPFRRVGIKGVSYLDHHLIDIYLFGSNAMGFWRCVNVYQVYDKNDDDYSQGSKTVKHDNNLDSMGGDCLDNAIVGLAKRTFSLKRK